MRFFVAALFVVLVFAASILGSYWLGVHALDHSQAQWCDVLRLLTSHKVPRPRNPAANPSRENSYLFYADLVRLRGNFGCRS